MEILNFAGPEKAQQVVQVATEDHQEAFGAG